MSHTPPEHYCPTPEESVNRGDLGGECYGKPQRPDPEGQWRDI